MAVLTVSQVNNYIKRLIDEIPPMKNLYVSGEISNFKHYYQSGHMYFTLKDQSSQLKCVMFAFDNSKLKFQPENGMKVICFGQVGVYERDGVYQLYARDMQVEGIGSLTVAFEQLKEKLEKEGLFDEAHKKPIPKYPSKIGVATSNMGAAVEDIKNILSRRFPLCEVVIVPTVVQGDAAAADIASSVAMLDAMGDIDTIIVGRGGGSIEDLWAFNTEAVARAVYQCRTPIISAVGHETDYTICDFVADLRAPTPSAAAELAVPDAVQEMLRLQQSALGMEAAFQYRLQREEQRLQTLKENTVLANAQLFFDSLLDNFSAKQEKLLFNYQKVLAEKESALKQSASALHALSPLAILGRGYSIIKKDNAVISSAEALQVDDTISLTMSKGSAQAVITEVKQHE